MEDQAYQLRNMISKSAAQKSVRTIAVSSGKGGVGKTSISVNLAITLASMRKKVLVIDADMGLANIDILLGIKPKYNLRHIINGEKTIEEVIVDGPCGIKILPSASGVQSLAQLNKYQRDLLMGEFIRIQNSVDFLIIDTAAGISDNVTEFILAAGEAIVVTTPEPTAITDAYALIKVLNRYPGQLKIKLFVNMVKDEKEAKDIEEILKLISDRFLKRDIEGIGYMIKDPFVSAAIKKQVPFVLYNQKCQASSCIKILATRLCNYSVKENNKTLSGFLEKVTGLNK